MVIRFTGMEKKLTNSGPLMESTSKHSIYPHVITCAMVESPRLCFDDVSQEPMRLLTGLASSMTDMCSWNMHTRSDMIVAMGP
jgi:hypothetical protein